MSIYKRGGCDKKGPNGSCSKCGKKRGSCGVYWYKFMWRGELVRKTTKQGNNDVAREKEAEHRTRLSHELRVREEKALQLGCDPARLLICAECDKWFIGDFALVMGEGQKLCSQECLKKWDSRRKPIVTLKGFCQDRVEPWARSTFEQAAPKTWLWYCFGINSVKNSSVLGGLRLNEIGPEKVAEFASERQRDGLQISSINSCLRALRRILRLAVEWGVVESAPKIKFLSGEHRRERVISETEEARYLTAAPPLLHDVSIVLFDTGMRPEECHCLRWEHVNWAGGRNGAVLIAKGKTKAARRVLPLSPRVRMMLENRCAVAACSICEPTSALNARRVVLPPVQPFRLLSCGPRLRRPRTPGSIYAQREFERHKSHKCLEVQALSFSRACTDRPSRSAFAAESIE